MIEVYLTGSEARLIANALDMLANQPFVSRPIAEEANRLAGRIEALASL